MEEDAAFTHLRGLLQSFRGDLAVRQLALASLLEARDKELPPILLRLVIADPDLRGAALRGLASYDAAETPGVILVHWIPVWVIVPEGNPTICVYQR